MPTPSRGILGLLLVFFILATATSAAMADGKIFNRYASAAPTRIPDQQAIIVYDAAKQLQTLAIETRFHPPPSSAPPETPVGRDQPAPFAWVVPLPGPEAPMIRPATAGLFPTVRAVFQPRVRDSGEGFASPLVICTVLILLALLVTTQQRSQKLIALLICIPIALLLVLLLLPSLGTARSSLGGSDSLVRVLDRTTVGSFDITVIGAAAPGAGKAAQADAGKQLAAWLKGNGFQMPAGVEPVLDGYAARQWIFAACKLREPPSGSPGPALAPHPLIFTFKSPQCVYPLALTGVGNGPLSVDLYVLSSQRAAAPNFQEVRCATLTAADFKDAHYPSFARSGNVRLVHPLLQELAAGTTVATKLSATLSPKQQTTDAFMTWHPPRELGGLKYSRAGASGHALDFASGALLVGLIVLLIIAAARKQNGAWVFRKIGWPLSIALVLGGGVYAALPKVEIIPGGYRAMWRLPMYHDEAYTRILEFLELKAPDWIEQRRERGEPAAISLDDARRAAEAGWEKLSGDVSYLPRLEDSPLNYTIEPGSQEGTIEYVWYDVDGAPTRLQLWPIPPQDPAKRPRR